VHGNGKAVLLPPERNRWHQHPHLPAKRSVRRLAGN
jgi:hypothetical protein